MHLWVVSFLVLLFAWHGSAQNTGNGACWGFPYYSESGGSGRTASLLEQPILTNTGFAWANIIAGQYATCGVTQWSGGSGGELYCWGNPNYNEYLGGDTWFAPSASDAPLQVSSSYPFYTQNIALSTGVDDVTMCAIFSPPPHHLINNLVCYGLVGIATAGVVPSPLVPSPGGQTYSSNPNSVCIGNGFACAITELVVGSGNNLFCFGPSAGATSGLVTNTPNLAYPDYWSSVSCGNNFVVALDSNSKLYYWGNSGAFSNWGDLGFVALPVHTPTTAVLAVAAGYDHFCIVNAANDHLRCYGYLAAISAAPDTHIVSSLPFSGSINPSVIAMAAFGGCVQVEGASPYCWYANEYNAGEIAVNLFPTPPGSISTFASLSGGWDYFCGTW